MAGDEGLVFTTLLLIVAVFLRKRSRFLRNLRLLSLRGRQGANLAFLLSIQRRNRPRRRKLAWVYPRPQFWFEELLNNRNLDHLWREHFRVNRNTFDFICGIVGPYMSKQDTILRQAIPVEKRVAIALWRLATGNSYRTVALSFGIGRCTAMNIKDEFCSALMRRVNEFIKFPKTEDETRRCIQGFQNISTFPQVVGALDGSHIPITAPTENPNEYRNRKNFHSIVLQGVADANMKFIHI
ncbi:protein ANTAGONIST OF LIKE HETEROCHROMATIN PROTEIN 1-like [Actinia tenebrosa]|uniref:Protein ANTAGONIST OF LIKE HETEROCHROMATIN PROTEIN 1-like n=1 Tax=Actinia tenebrosa TaxID=6105 RepID=A0A6P8HMX0_ACTTE|nr:protein ANTAGONIST OF LIKE HETEROCHROMATIN PROTEIN 1-like [Actinia tenebrosa]